MGILRKEYCTRRGRAIEAFRTRAKSRGRPVDSGHVPNHVGLWVCYKSRCCTTGGL